MPSPPSLAVKDLPALAFVQNTLRPANCGESLTRPLVRPTWMRASALLLLACVAGSTACDRGGRGPGPITPGSRPGASVPSSPSASADAASGPLQELTLTWSIEDEALLDLSLSDGIAVVRRAAGQTHLLTDCVARGSYQPDPRVPADATVRTVQDDAGPHPAGGRRVASLRFMELIRLVADRQRVDPLDGTGACAGATHFVSALTRGAYDAQVHTTVPSGPGAGSRGVSRKSGDLSHCTTPGATKDAQCRAVVRVELTPIASR